MPTTLRAPSRTRLFRIVLALALLAGAGTMLLPPEAAAAGPPPQIVSISPPSGATNVATNTAISVGFSEAMNAASLSGALDLYQGFFSPVSGSVSYNASTFVATFVPASPLATSRTYTVVLSTSATDLDGNAAPFRYWSFTTAAAGSPPTSNTAPQVRSTTPAAGATGVATNATLRAVFNEAMSASTINTSTFTLSGPGGAIVGNVSYETGSLTGVFTPSATLAAGASYTATVTTGVRDTGGTAMAANTTWSFTTASASAPPATPSLTQSGPMLIENRNGVTIENLKISSTSGHCLVIKNSQNVTVRNSEIGTCRGNAVYILSSSNINIVDNYIHPEANATACCDTGDGIYAHLSDDVLVQGNVIAFGETNVIMLGTRDSQVIGNYMLNPLGPHPRGSQVQVWSHQSTRSSNMRIEANYMVASRDPKYARQERQTDAISFGYTDGAVVTGNYITGGQAPSGCGIMADVSANSMQFLTNTIIETGECGLGIASGTNQVIDGNRIYAHGLNDPNVGNTALYVWDQHWPSGCGPVRISNNISVLIRPNGYLSSYWKGSGCNTTTLSGNTFDQAAIDAMTPLETKNPPPTSIPPRPYQTKVASPFTR